MSNGSILCSELVLLKSSLPIYKDLEMSLRQPFSGMINTSLPIHWEPQISLRPSLHGLLHYQVKGYHIDKRTELYFCTNNFLLLYYIK